MVQESASRLALSIGCERARPTLWRQAPPDSPSFLPTKLGHRSTVVSQSPTFALSFNYWTFKPRRKVWSRRGVTLRWEGWHLEQC